MPLSALAEPGKYTLLTNMSMPVLAFPMASGDHHQGLTLLSKIMRSEVALVRQQLADSVCRFPIRLGSGMLNMPPRPKVYSTIG